MSLMIFSIKKEIFYNSQLRITAAYRYASGLTPSLGLKPHSSPSRSFAYAKTTPTLTPSTKALLRGTSVSLIVMCNGLNVVYDGSSDHGAVRRGHGSKKEKKGSGRL